MSEIDQLFDRIRRGAFDPGNDPFESIHEMAAMSGNAQPAGWYEGHEFSSSIGQANRLVDPLFETFAGSITPTALVQTLGQWNAKYVLNSGTAPASSLIDVFALRGAQGGRWNSAALEILVDGIGANACNVDYYLYPTDTADYADLDGAGTFVVAACKVAGTALATVNLSDLTAQVSLQIYETSSGTVVAESPVVDATALTAQSTNVLVAAYEPTTAYSATIHYQWRLKYHISHPATSNSKLRMVIAEPQINWNFTPDALPFTPAIGSWFVTEADISLSDVTGSDVSSTAHGFAPKSPADATKFLNGAATPAYAQVKDSDLSLSDVTTNNVSTTKHGFTPKAPNDATKFLDGTGAWDTVKETDLSLSDVTTNDVSTTKHGLVPKAPNDTTKFLRGDGTWAVPSSAVSLTNSSSALGADVSVGVANTFSTALSVTPAAGTYLLLATLTFADIGTGAWTARIYNGASAEAEAYEQSGQDATVSMHAIVTTAGSTTYSLQAASTDTTGSIKKSSPNNGQNKATMLSYVKIA